MGTRGAIGFISDKKEYITYNHFDSYPDGLGNDVLNFLNSTRLTVDVMKERVKEIRLINERKDEPTDEDIKKCMLAKTVNTGVSEQSFQDWYCLLREAQGKLDKYLEVGIMPDNHDFLLDSLFCEWAYIINLDTSKLEVYKGFNRNQNGKGRYAKKYLKTEHRETVEYYGVTLVAEIDLFNLPKAFGEYYNEDDDSYSLKLIYDEEWKNEEITLDE